MQNSKCGGGLLQYLGATAGSVVGGASAQRGRVGPKRCLHVIATACWLLFSVHRESRVLMIENMARRRCCCLHYFFDDAENQGAVEKGAGYFLHVHGQQQGKRGTTMCSFPRPPEPPRPRSGEVKPGDEGSVPTHENWVGSPPLLLMYPKLRAFFPL